MNDVILQIDINSFSEIFTGNNLLSFCKRKLLDKYVDIGNCKLNGFIDPCNNDVLNRQFRFSSYVGHRRNRFSGFENVKNKNITKIFPPEIKNIYHVSFNVFNAIWSDDPARVQTQICICINNVFSDGKHVTYSIIMFGMKISNFQQATVTLWRYMYISRFFSASALIYSKS